MKTSMKLFNYLLFRTSVEDAIKLVGPLTPEQLARVQRQERAQYDELSECDKKQLATIEEQGNG